MTQVADSLCLFLYTKQIPERIDWLEFSEKKEVSQL